MRREGDVEVQIPTRARGFLFSTMSRPIWGPPFFLFTGYRGYFPGYSGRGVMVITQLRLALRWRITGVSTHPKN